MTRRYLLLSGVVLAAAVAVTLIGRMPHGAAAPDPVAAPVPTHALALTIADGNVNPAHASVPKNHDVVLEVRNQGAAAVDFELAGYADRVKTRIGAGEEWTVRFRADRPGGDFPWLVDGAPTGRLVVTGSHLVEGHR